MSKHENDSSTENLVKFHREASLSDAENHDLFVVSVRDKIRTLTVEPLLLFFAIITILQAYVNNQYIYYRIGKDFGIVANETSAYVCQVGVNNSENVTNRIQTLNAQYQMLIQLSLSVCTILTAPFYCVFSDRFGRRVMFLLPAVGVFLKTGFEIFIQIYELNLYWFVFSEGFYGLFGGFIFVMGLCYSYMADISTQKARTRRMAILGGFISVGALLVSLVAGYWIKANGYLIPYIFTCVLGGLCIIYPLVFLKESPKMPSLKGTKPTMKQQLRNLIDVYADNCTEKRALLIIMLVMLNFYYVTETSTSTLANSYLMAYPICMNVVSIGIFLFINMLANNIGVVICVVLLSRWISDLTIILLCLMTAVVFSLQMAFTVSMTTSFIAAGTNLVSYGGFPFIRGYLSKSVSSQNQGALFGGIVLTEAISSSVTKVISIYFYGATFIIFHGMVYLLLCGLVLIAIILTSIAIILDRKVRKIENTFEIN